MVAHTPSPYTNINLECLKDVNIRNDAIKLLEETAGKTFSDINCFLRSVSQSKKKRKNKQDLIKRTRQALVQQKELEVERKDNLQNGREYLQMTRPTRA